MFNVSRVPVREALCALELNGLVDSVQGVGVYVKARPMPFSPEWMQRVEPCEAIRARLVLEPDIAREAALHISAEEKVRLGELIEEFRRRCEAGESYAPVEKAIHLCIAAAGGSVLYEMLMTIIFEAVEREQCASVPNTTGHTPEALRQYYEELDRIVRAIIDGRADDAHAFMKKHIFRRFACRQE